MVGTSVVAIVNDEAAVRELLSWNLTRAGHEVRCYSSTADALELLERPADIALLDRTNAPLDGVEIYKRLRAAHGMPIVFLSAWGSSLPRELRRQGLAPADGYVQLPFRVAEVVDLVQSILEAPQQRGGKR